MRVSVVLIILLQNFEHLEDVSFSLWLLELLYNCILAAYFVIITSQSVMFFSPVYTSAKFREPVVKNCCTWVDFLRYAAPTSKLLFSTKA